MKTAQDISPTAVLCLGLGLLVGNMMMPQLQKFDHDALGILPTQEAATPCLSKGRSLERLPEDMDDSSSEVERDLRIKAAQGNETAIQELIDLLHRMPAQKPALMSDSAALMMIASFTILGVAATFTDVNEFTKEEEEKASSPATSPTNSESAIVNEAARFPILKALVVCLVIVAASGLFQRLSGFSLPDTRTSTEQRPPLAPDSYVMSFLAAFVVCGLFVMKSDVREMAEEMRKASGSEVEQTLQVENDEPAHPSHWSASRLLVGVGALVALAGIAVAMSCKGRVSTNFVDQASSAELKAIAQLFDCSFNVLLDFVLELFLAACTVIGLAVMRVDVRDMVKQLQYEAGPKGALPSPIRKKVE